MNYRIDGLKNNMKISKCLYCDNKNISELTYRLDGENILRCGHCGVMMTANISKNRQDLYDVEYFEKGKETKVGYANYLSSPTANLMGKYAFARLFVEKSGDYLDLGCADGSLVEIFKKEGFNASGLDISKAAIDIANGKGLNVSFSDLRSFPENQPKSDLITAFDLLQHIERPGDLLRLVYDNLKKDGLFCFSTLNITKNDPSDYWFNTSFEHCVYYNYESLSYIFDDVFGRGNYSLMKIDKNGIAEIWGIAKKGELREESAIMNQIKNGTFNEKNPEQGYLLSLLYDQLSRFNASLDIIKYFEKAWPTSKTIQAKFYNNFYQGKMELAICGAESANSSLPVDSIFWQALCNAESVYFTNKKNSMEKEANEEIVSLREQLFTTRDQLHALTNSRVVGRIIKARDYVGDNIPRIKHAPRKAISIVKPIIADATPNFIRIPIRRVIRHDYGVRNIKIRVKTNKKWDNNSPLVSVIIPYYNLAATIDETLQSLDCQTFKDFETILVNDGSTDSVSIKKLKQIKKSRPDLMIINQANQGVAATRNNGIGHSEGKYIICLDSDDILLPTYIEKVVIELETNPDVSVVTSYMEMFGVKNEIYKHAKYDPLELFKNNMVITAAGFRKKVWELSGGYKSKIGYEDWEYWINLAEYGFWAKQIAEPLFKYRIAMQSRYVGDKNIHWDNIKKIHALHPKFKLKIKSILNKRKYISNITSPESAFINLNNKTQYNLVDSGRNSILIAMPWMTFGGAETLILNFCREIKDVYNLHFITGLKSENEWEYKFKEISPFVYHLSNLFDSEDLYLEFISNYISTHNINVLHMVHTDFVFKMLPEIKKRHPQLKIVITMFNDRVPHYFKPSIELNEYVDIYASDNSATANHYKQKLPGRKTVLTIPNGIDCYDIFNPTLFDRKAERTNLGLSENDIAVFFIGRLSEEKNPDVFLNAAKEVLGNNKKPAVKFFVIGDGAMRLVIEKQIASIGSKNIKYLGYQTDIARFLSAADIFVLPSSIEGFPLSILEAMAMKVVVVASDVGAVSDVLDNGRDGFIIKPGSAEDISRIIIKLYNNREVLEKTKIAARSKLEKKYSNAVLKKNYLKLYKDVLK